MKRSTMEYFDVEVSLGSRWMSLNDHVRYVVGAASLEDSSISMRNTTASSSMYDGAWVVHSARDNVAETLEVRVLGPTSSMVEEYAADLVEAFKQLTYRVRVSINDHVETWQCFPADHSRSRGHVYSHNVMQVVRLSVPRLPDVDVEVRS